MKQIMDKEGKTYPFSKTVHTKWGMLKTDDMVDNIGKTNKGIEMYQIDQTFHDMYRKLKRGAQIMLPKDIAAIIGRCNLTKDSRIIDCGAGSGGTTCMLASLIKKVYSYDIREDHLKIAKKNAEMLGLKNIVFKEVDIYKKCPDKNMDAIILDVAQPWEAIDVIKESLNSGGFLINYSPNLTQVKKFVLKIQESPNFFYSSTIELIEREWEIDEMKMRPKFRMLGHTAFLSFARRV